jgi:uncharacterized protein YdaU (DUF1376 family)
MPLLLPFFKFYVLDWLTSEKIMQMSSAQVGSYIMLLAHCWAQATCTIPADRSTLYKLSKWTGTEAEFEPVLSCFKPFKKDGGRLVNPRLYAEWSEAVQRIEVLSESGQKGALKRWAKKQPGPKGAVKPLAADWLTTIKANPAYKHLSIETELAKMDAWLSTRPGRKRTKRFIVDWLNRIEAPVTSNGGIQRPPPPPPKNDPIGRGIWGRTYGDPRKHGYD